VKIIDEFTGRISRQARSEAAPAVEAKERVSIRRRTNARDDHLPELLRLYDKLAA